MIKITIPEIDNEFCVKCNISKINGIMMVETLVPKERSGIYLFFSEDDELLYIGKTSNLLKRIKSHLMNDKNTLDIKHNFYMVRCIYVDDAVERDIYETYMIDKLKPLLNVNKVYTYKSRHQDNKYKSLQKLNQEKKEQIESDEIYLSLGEIF